LRISFSAYIIEKDGYTQGGRDTSFYYYKGILLLLLHEDVKYILFKEKLQRKKKETGTSSTPLATRKR